MIITNNIPHLLAEAPLGLMHWGTVSNISMNHNKTSKGSFFFTKFSPNLFLANSHRQVRSSLLYHCSQSGRVKANTCFLWRYVKQTKTPSLRTAGYAASHTRRKVLSALFQIHELTDTLNWLNCN